MFPPFVVSTKVAYSALGAAVMDTLDIAGDAKKTEECEQAKKTSQARQTEQTLTSGNEIKAAEESEEAQESKPTVAGDMSEFVGEGGFVCCCHVVSPIVVG